MDADLLGKRSPPAKNTLHNRKGGRNAIGIGGRNGIGMGGRIRIGMGGRNQIGIGGRITSESAPTVVAALMELMDDLHADVRAGAACALGRLGWTEARQALVRLLEDAPTVGVIEALAGVADDDVVVLLGRVARARPVLADTVLAALDELASTMAVKVANGLRVEQR